MCFGRGLRWAHMRGQLEVFGPGCWKRAVHFYVREGGGAGGVVGGRLVPCVPDFGVRGPFVLDLRAAAWGRCWCPRGPGLGHVFALRGWGRVLGCGAVGSSCWLTGRSSALRSRFWHLFRALGRGAGFGSGVGGVWWPWFLPPVLARGSGRAGSGRWGLACWVRCGCWLCRPVSMGVSGFVSALVRSQFGRPRTPGFCLSSSAGRSLQGVSVMFARTAGAYLGSLCSSPVALDNDAKPLGGDGSFCW